MKLLKSLNFSIFLLTIAGSASAADILPANDPYETQPEASAAEVASRVEERVAVPRETSSYFAVAGFQATETEVQNTELHKGDSGIAFCHSSKWSTACLSGLIVYRCGQYTFPLTPYGCAMASAVFVDSLEMKRIDVLVDNMTYNLPVIFTARLEKLIQNRSTQNDLQSLRLLLESSAKRKSKFDLWEWFRAMSNGNLTKAMENMAVLLQDTTGVAIQINYLKTVAKARGFSPATMKAIDDLAEVNYQLDLAVLKENDAKSWLRLYPQTKNIEADVTPLVYHFYPMALTARLLQRAGFGDRLSSFIPFLFNTEYLNQTLDPEQWPFHHPKPFKLDSDWKRWKMRDMYNGYAGALWGIQKTKYLQGLESFQTEYAKAPYETMRHYFWSMPSP